METGTKKPTVASPPSETPTEKAPDLASASVADTLATLKVNPETGLARAEVDTRRNQNGYNEVAERKGHPVLKFLRKFWGISAWMLELIMVLSAVLRNYSDLVVVGALLVINAGLSFMQERRAAGVVEALRRRLQVSARVRRDSSWQVIPARELVPGDIVRVRPGDIIPADVKLLTGQRGKSIGLLHLDVRGTGHVKRWLEQGVSAGQQNLYYDLVVGPHFGEAYVEVVDVGGLKWFEIDNLTDLERARRLFS